MNQPNVCQQTVTIRTERGPRRFVTEPTGNPTVVGSHNHVRVVHGVLGNLATSM